MFSRLKDFVDENSVETSVTGINQYIKAHLVNLQARFSQYLPEAVRNKYCGVFAPCKNCNIETRSHDYATVDEAMFSPCRAEP
jgi:hypothetical protein